MSPPLFDTIAIIEVMENHVERIRPPEHIRDKLDITYKIENQSVILQEIRPVFNNQEQKTEFGYAKPLLLSRAINGMFIGCALI